MLDWDGNVIEDLLVKNTGRFLVKHHDKEPGNVEEMFPTLGDRSVNIYGQCAALVYRTFVREPPHLPLLQ